MTSQDNLVAIFKTEAKFLRDRESVISTSDLGLVIPMVSGIYFDNYFDSFQKFTSRFEFLLGLGLLGFGDALFM